MITPENNLVYGDFINDVRTSEKFTSVRKIIYDDINYYMLNDGNIYVNRNIHNDNFVMINCDINVDTNIKFIDIETARSQIYVVGTDNKLYVISNNLIRNIDNENYNCNHIINIGSIYSALIYGLFLKSDNGEYYILHDNYSLKYVENFDKILFTHASVIFIKGENIKFEEYYNSQFEIPVLNQIPEGSLLKYYHTDTTCDAIEFSPTSIHDKIVIASNVPNAVMYICCLSGNVYHGRRRNTGLLQELQELPKLKGCSFNTLHVNSRYANTKNANNICTN
jgi:hypothetical protein